MAGRDACGSGHGIGSWLNKKVHGTYNACHQAAGHRHIMIKRPGMLPFSNQEFYAKTT